MGFDVGEELHQVHLGLVSAYSPRMEGEAICLVLCLEG